jgi:translation initiation factor IF-3
MVRILLLLIAVPEPEVIDLSFDLDKHDLLFKLGHTTSFPDRGMIVGIEVYLEGEMGKSAEIFFGAQREFAARMASHEARLRE